MNSLKLKWANSIFQDGLNCNKLLNKNKYIIDDGLTILNKHGLIKTNELFNMT